MLEASEADNIKAEILQPKEVDVTKRYAFIIEEESFDKESLLNIFTNSLVISTNSTLNAENTDAVVFITRKISHTLYYNIKNQCKQKRIPYYHCPQQNIEIIKNYLRNI